MLTDNPEELTIQILLNTPKLITVESSCEGVTLNVNKQELNLFSEKYKLPYGTLEYLLKCSSLKGIELMKEFLKQDDIRVLEYYPTDEVITALFSSRETNYDCPRITALSLEKEEWDDVCSDMRIHELDYPLVRVVKNNLEKTLQVLLKDERTIVGMPCLITAIELRQMETLAILLSHRFLDVDICKEDIIEMSRNYGLDVERVQELLRNVKNIIS